MNWMHGIRANEWKWGDDAIFFFKKKTIIKQTVGTQTCHQSVDAEFLIKTFKKTLAKESISHYFLTI
jgi:hypothetical protein